MTRDDVIWHYLTGVDVTRHDVTGGDVTKGVVTMDVTRN